VQEKQYWIGGQSLYGNPARDLIYRMQRVSPMATSPHDPDVLYYGSQYVHRTRDRGVTWERISPDLTANPPCCQGASGEPITRDITGEEFYSTLYAITESPLERGVIWAGANDGPFHVTRDNGKTWTNITPQDLPAGPGGRVQFIEASPHRKGSAYYATYRYLLGDYQPYIYRTDDYGKSWTRLTDGRNGIPADTPARVVREDPDREGLLYAGTEFGMYASFDNGAHWQPFHLNLPAVPVTDIKVHRKDLVVATQGRGFWILDNLSSLHQLTPQTAARAVTLYKPRDGYRTRVSPATLGPMIEYYLAAAPPGPVTIEILDGKGTVVNSYNSDAPAPAGRGGRGGRGGGGAENIDPDMLEGRVGGRGRFGGPARVTKTDGVNRYVWDVRGPHGVLMPPGLYQARLKVGDEVQTQPVTVKIDPRVAADGVTEADLREQYEHNLRVRELVEAVTNVAARVREAQTRLRNSTGADAGTANKIAAIAEKVFTEPVRYGKPGIQAHITYLAGMTTSVDQKVGRDAIERYQVLKKELEGITAELDGLGGSK